MPGSARSTPDFLTLASSWRERGAGLAKALIFIIVSQALFRSAMHALHPRIDLSPHGSIAGFLYLELIQLVFAVILPLVLLLVACNEPLRLAGWGRPIQVRQLLQGLATGLGLIAGVIGALALLGDYSPGPLLLSPIGIVKYGALYLPAMLLVAIGEESIFRGYALTQLTRAMSFWPAALLTSALFGAAHLANTGMTLVGAISVAVAGLVLAYAFKRTGALYYSSGLHAGWDGGSTFLFGAVSVGLRLPDTLFHAEIHGPIWLTGGRAGPIGGSLAIAAFLLAMLYVAVRLRPNIGARVDQS